MIFRPHEVSYFSRGWFFVGHLWGLQPCFYFSYVWVRLTCQRWAGLAQPTKSCVDLQCFFLRPQILVDLKCVLLRPGTGLRWLCGVETACARVRCHVSTRVRSFRCLRARDQFHHRVLKGIWPTNISAHLWETRFFTCHVVWGSPLVPPCLLVPHV